MTEAPVPVVAAPPPIITFLNACSIVLERRPQGDYQLSFTHLSGVVQFVAIINDENLDDIMRQRSGIKLANGVDLSNIG